MKAKLRAMLMIASLLCLLSMQGLAEEEFKFELPDHIRIATEAEIDVSTIAADRQANRCTVTLFDFQAYFVPSLFPDGMISSIEESAYMGAADEKSVDIQFSDGSQLYLPSALSMEWMGENAAKYRQLLRYLYDNDLSLEPYPLDFMSPEEAVNLCKDILERMNLHSLTATAVYGLSGDALALYTDRMAADYSDMKLERFSQFSDHDAVYCVEFRSAFDDKTTVGGAPFPLNDGAQCLFVIREDGPVYIEMNKVIERFDSVTAQPIALSLEDALRLFCEGKETAKSDADDYEITRIALGYGESVGDLAYANRQTTYVPYYQMNYVYTVHFGDQENRSPCEILMNALDGAIVKIRGV